MRVAVLIDGQFFLRRLRSLHRDDKDFDPWDAEKIADDLHKYALDHCRYAKYDGQQKNEKKEANILYRVFFYDCPPFTGRVHSPLTNKLINFSKSKVAAFQNQLIDELKKKRKVALRLGELRNVENNWVIRSRAISALFKRKRKLEDLTDDDISFELKQKQVDMKIGLDIASLAYKKLVDRIILVAGDSDFVPAAKVARREGIDFVLDPMWQHINEDLFEHIDGLNSVCKKPKTS